VTEAPAGLANLEGSARAVVPASARRSTCSGASAGSHRSRDASSELAAGTDAAILDTRKTTPGLRALEKYAVRCGGGRNHRRGLDDAILVKDNHLRLAGGIGAAVAALRSSSLPVEVEVEVEAETLAEVREALEAGAERILLDNMTPAEVARAVELVAGRA